MPKPEIRFEILMDHQENKRQCTIHPLRERADFRVKYFKRGASALHPLEADILLHVDGIPLDEFVELEPQPKVNSVATIDCTWKYLAPTLKRLPSPLPRLVKIPADFVTAYPRKSKKAGLDPDGGLATIEALFIAGAFFGNWDESLLDKFHFKNQFLELNAENWKKYGLRE